MSSNLETITFFLYLSGSEEAKCLACFYLPTVGDASRESTETIAPFLTIVGVDTTFLSSIKKSKNIDERGLKPNSPVEIK